MNSHRNSRCPSPLLTSTRKTRRQTLRTLVPLVVMGLVWAGSNPATAVARDGDGTVLLSWTKSEAIGSGTSEIVQSPIPPEQLTVILIGSGRERVVSLAQPAPIRIPGVDPGLVRLELRHGMGVLAVWETLVRAEISTPVEIDLNRGTVQVSPISPEPFGSWETWNEDEIQAIPGLSHEGLDDIDTRAGRRQDPILDGLGFSSRDRLRPRSVGLDQSIVGAQRPLGTGPAYRDGGNAMRILTRPLPGRGVRVGGSAGNGNRYLGDIQLRDRYTTRGGGALDFSGQVQFRSFDIAGPLEALNADLDHDDETAIEVRARGSYDQPRGRIRADFYARGSERNYNLLEFQDGLNHAPREDRGSLTAALAYDLRLGAQDLSLETTFGREFSETGDGEAFDDFSSYNRSGSLPDTDPSGLYWLGDDPTTPGDEGKLYDYYERSLIEEWGVSTDLTRDLLVPGGLRVGAELQWTDWRLFEHLRPSRVVASGDEAGYVGVTRNFGYTFDGDSQDDGPGHGTRRARQLALYASQKAALGNGSVEAGLRFDRFSPGQNPLADLGDPTGTSRAGGDPSTIDAVDLVARPNHDLVSPRVGLYTAIGDALHLWADGGRRQIVPPFQALYYDAEFLAIEAGLADVTTDRLTSALIHGNPELAPEDEWSGQLGVYHRASSNLALRLSGYASQTTDTWVAHSFERTFGSIDFYENGGERRELGLHLGLDFSDDAGSLLRVQYDLSRTETDVIEPYPLYEHLRYEGLPIGNIAVAQSRLRSTHWIDDGVDRGFFPSLWDRTHRVSVLWSREVRGFGLQADGGRNPRLSVALRAASGAPYTPTFVRSEGDLTDATDPGETTNPDRWTGEIHSERLPASWQIDFAYSQPLTVLSREVDLRIEVRNLTDHKNPQYVHPATGEADDDGWLETAAGQQAIDQNGDGFESDYQSAIESPLHYTEGLTARAAITVALF